MLLNRQAALVLLAFAAGKASVAHSWRMSDEVTLHFWSPVSECFDQDELADTCGVRGVNAGYVLDNTGATCYANPTPSDEKAFTWLGPLGPDLAGPNAPPDREVYLFSMFFFGDQPKPECDSKGVCSCDIIDIYRGNGSDPVGWEEHLEMSNSSYSIVSTSFFFTGFSGCGVNGKLTPLNGTESYCTPFQGNITVGNSDLSAAWSAGVINVEVAIALALSFLALN